MTRFENVGVFVREKVWLEPNLFPYKYSNIFKLTHPSYLSAYEDGTDRVFRNVGIYTSDAGELPRRKHTTFRTRRMFEIKNSLCFIVCERTYHNMLGANHLKTKRRSRYLKTQSVPRCKHFSSGL